jgi:hypothetical protein
MSDIDIPSFAPITMVRCDNQDCAWRVIRFPLNGADVPGTFRCPGCHHEMLQEFGDPHPINYIRQLIRDIEAEAAGGDQ